MEWIRRETIGHGSFSTVSLATTTSGNSTAFPPLIAVKSSGIVCSSALMNERDVLNDLGDDECSEIVKCFGDAKTVENGEEIYNLFLEYASGGNLSDRIKKSALSEFEIRRFTKSIVKGLCHIHKNGISHCDLKLENILVFGDGDVRISDFGLAKRSGEEEEDEIIIRGTPMYMAPESVNYGEFESPVDIWGLGCCVVEMFSGETAWCLEEGSANVMLSLMIRIGSEDEVPRIPMELSEEGRDFVKKCFVKNPTERWTAQMLLDHPFLVLDDELRCGQEVVSPRDPFEFPGWNSIQSPVSVSSSSSPFSSLISSPEERMRSLVTENEADWSVSGDWVNVR